jgi:Domain of unknown function (DUF4082)
VALEYITVKAKHQNHSEPRRRTFALLVLAVLAVATSGISGYCANPPHNARAINWAETSVWGEQALPENVDSGDAAAAEVGVRFRSHVKGWITAIRFYKSPANTGRHVATLWTATGTKLATAAFTAESASGWQQVNFARRVAIRADETYVASYHTDAGHYSADPYYFVAGRDNGTLDFLESTSKSGNGVYQESAGSAFPTKSRLGTNYWVDVVFVPEQAPRGDSYLPWEGGAAYYKKWINGPAPNGDPNFFPIGVWYQNPSTAEGYKSLGVNLFVALPRGARAEQLAAAGMGVFYLGVHKRFVVPDERKALLAEWGRLTRAWGQIDEPDNAQPLPGRKGYGPCVPPREVVAVYEQYQKNDPTRPVYLGVGKSVDDNVTHMRGVCTGHYEDFPAYIRGSDIVSYDSYPVNVRKPLWYVAKGMDELRAWANYRKPVYEAVETTAIQATAGKPTPDEVRSEVWMLIIHGGMGVIYFCHIFTPTLDPAGLLHDPVMSRAVAALDRQILSLAPVLNTPSVSNGVRVSSSNGMTPVDTMLKRWRGSTYLFTVAARPGGPATATFTLRDCPSHATATVLDENRSIDITDGTFQDEFAKSYQVHVYQIAFSPRRGKTSATR